MANKADDVQRGIQIATMYPPYGYVRRRMDVCTKGMHGRFLADLTSCKLRIYAREDGLTQDSWTMDQISIIYRFGSKETSTNMQRNV